MNRLAAQLRLALRESLLLKLAAVLILGQFTLWTIPSLKKAEHAPSHATAGLFEFAIDRTSAFFRANTIYQTAPVRDLGRYYNPGLVIVADDLDAESRYFVAMALEDCYALSHDGFERFRDDFVRRLDPRANNWAREAAFHQSIHQCVAFEREPISPERVLSLLRSAARDGDPRALARTLLFRDLADSKAGSFDLVTRLLSSGDPHAIRDVGLFLTRGESTVALDDGGLPVRATTLAVAWELVACDFGMECGGDSKILTSLCAYQGQCGATSYEDWLSRYTESGEELAEIRRLRMLLRRGLIAQDWQLLGLSVLKPEAQD